jgi:hypothetical protein
METTNRLEGLFDDLPNNAPTQRDGSYFTEPEWDAILAAIAEGKNARMIYDRLPAPKNANYNSFRNAVRLQQDKRKARGE